MEGDPSIYSKVCQLNQGTGISEDFLTLIIVWGIPFWLLGRKWVNIRLCIDYRLVSYLTQLMIDPMPLSKELLEIRRKLSYCSLNMKNDFWVVDITERARRISVFVTPPDNSFVFGCHSGSRICLKYTNDLWIMFYMVFTIFSGKKFRWIRRYLCDKKNICKIGSHGIGSNVMNRRHSNSSRILELLRKKVNCLLHV